MFTKEKLLNNIDFIQRFPGNHNRILLICCLIFGISNSSFSQHWDSLSGGKFQNANSVNVLFSDSSYIYSAGYFDKIGNTFIKGIARWNGIKWDSLGTGIDGLDTLNAYPQNTLALAKYHNKLYAGGVFSSLGKVKAECIGTWNGTIWDSISTQPFKSNITSSVDAIDTINNKFVYWRRF